jgi:peptidoglycan/LPS O-acetylase OafA/YrhL
VDLSGGLLLRRSRDPVAAVRPRAATAAAATRRADVQGLRAVAVLLVVAFHAGLPISGGFIGVDVFFAISGFVITEMLVRELESRGAIDLRGFYARRVKRLLPALALMLTAVAVLGALLTPAASQRMGALSGVTASLFAANAYLFNLRTGYFDVDTSLNPLLHTWTLAVAEQFYVVFPLALLIGWRVGAKVVPQSRRAAAASAVGALTILSFWLSLSLSGTGTMGGTASRFAFYGSPARAWEFGAGALVALGLPWLLQRLSAAGVLWIGIAGAAGLAAGVTSIDHTTAMPGTAALLPVCGACGLLLAGARSSEGLSRLLGLRPVAWVGDLSYSLYLWHWPLIVFATALWPTSGAAAPAAALASLVPAWLSFRFVENRIRYGSSISGRRVLALAATCVVVPLAASAGLLGVRSALAQTATMRSWARSQQLHADVVRNCYSPVPLDKRQDDHCTWRVARSRGEVVLVGDSNAGHFTEPVVKAANRAGFDAVVATYSSCPFVDVGIAEVTGPGERLCRRFFVGTMAALLRRRPALVIIAARTDRYVEAGYHIGLRVGSAPAVYDPAEKERVWSRALHTTVARLGRAGIRVLLVHPVPEFPHALQECTVLRILRNGCATTVSVGEETKRLGRSLEADRDALASLPSSWALDFRHRLCPRGECASARDGVILYRDGEHLSVDGALTLTGSFYAAIVAHARAAGPPRSG